MRAPIFLFAILVGSAMASENASAQSLACTRAFVPDDANDAVVSQTMLPAPGGYGDAVDVVGMHFSLDEMGLNFTVNVTDISRAEDLALLGGTADVAGYRVYYVVQ